MELTGFLRHSILCVAQGTDGSLAAWAKLLQLEDAEDLLTQTLDEEKSADEKLTEIAESAINVEDAEQTDEEETASNRRKAA